LESATSIQDCKIPRKKCYNQYATSPQHDLPSSTQQQHLPTSQSPSQPPAQQQGNSTPDTRTKNPAEQSTTPKPNATKSATATTQSSEKPGANTITLAGMPARPMTTCGRKLTWTIGPANTSSCVSICRGKLMCLWFMSLESSITAAVAIGRYMVG